MTMALSEADVRHIETLLAAAPGGEHPAAAVRRSLPGLSLTRCDVSDMSGEIPFRETPHYALYLVDGSSHCWRITSDPVQATGVVVAARRQVGRA
jgi:hypothetical protein